MADASDPIPSGWSLKTEVQNDGSKVSYYYCLLIGQQFFAYSEMIRYVDYAKEAKLSIYASDSDRFKAVVSSRRKKSGLFAQENHSSGHSSKLSADEQIKRSVDMDKTINCEDLDESKESGDADSMSDQAGLEMMLTYSRKRNTKA